jgi:uncharacterized protein YkwD
MRLLPKFLSLAILSLTVGLMTGCTAVQEPGPTPPFYERLDLTGRQVDGPSSIGMINQYRGNSGLRALKWNSALAEVAHVASDRMAQAGKVQSADEIRVVEALAHAGYRYKTYVANFSAGYRTFAEAFSGWRELKENNAHMLDGRVTEVGLATTLVPGSKYQVFWALVLAEPM